MQEHRIPPGLEANGLGDPLGVAQRRGGQQKADQKQGKARFHDRDKHRKQQKMNTSRGNILTHKALAGQSAASHGFMGTIRRAADRRDEGGQTK